MVRGLSPTTADVSEIVSEPSSTCTPFGLVTPKLLPSVSKVVAAVTDTAFGAIESTAPIAGTEETMVFARAAGRPKVARAANTMTEAVRTGKLRIRFCMLCPP